MRMQDYTIFQQNIYDNSYHWEGYNKCPSMYITLVARFKAWAVFARLKSGVVRSNLTRDMNVSVFLFFVCVALCMGSGLATSWSLVQWVLPTVYSIKALKKLPKSNIGSRAMVIVYRHITVMTESWAWSPENRVSASLGFWTLFIVRNSKYGDTTFWKLDLFPSSVKRMKMPTMLPPLQRAKHANVEVILRPTVSRPVCLGVRQAGTPIWDLRPIFLLLLCVITFRHLRVWRQVESGPCQRSLCRARVPQDSCS
jgi:hypothetical protein